MQKSIKQSGRPAVIMAVLSLLTAFFVISSTVFSAVSATLGDEISEGTINNSEGKATLDEIAKTPSFIASTGEKIDMLRWGAISAESNMTNALTQHFVKNGYEWTASSDKDTSDIETGYTLTTADDGKVSVDKSVIYGADDYSAFSYGKYEFSVALSTIAQEYNLYNKMTVDVPLDVVFILDTSGSMRQASGDNQTASYGDVTKASAMTTALNSAVRYLMQDANNRVGVVTYSDGAGDLIELDHYTTSNLSGNYFTYSESYSGSGNSRTVSGCTISTVSGGIRNSSGNTVAASTDSQDSGKVANWLGTYTQAGIARAAEMFENVNDTTYTDQEGNVIKRKPVFIMLSDGEPTYCNPEYENIINSSGAYTTIYGCGSSKLLDVSRLTNKNQNNKGVLGYYTILSANYYKNLVANHYRRTSNFYTIGEGTGPEGLGTINTSLTIAGDDYRRAVLNPTENNVEALADSSYTYADLTAHQLYQLLNNTFSESTVSIQPGSYTHSGTSANNVIGTSATSYNVPVSQNTYENYAYANRAYFGTLSSDELSDIFRTIVDESKETVEYGFALKTNTAVNFSDNIGDGMQVYDSPILRYNGTNYNVTEIKSPYDNGDSTVVKYVYDYSLSDTVMSFTRDVELSDIVVTVSTDKQTGQQTVNMAVPEACMPVIAHDDSGNWESQMPVRLLFKVKPTDEAIASAIAARQADPDAEIKLYTNSWRSTTTDVGASSEIYPSWNNPYYYDLDSFEEDEVQKNDNASGAYEYVKVSDTEIDPEADQNHHPAKHSVITIGNNGVLSIGNIKENIDVTVNKVWVDSSGNTITDMSMLPNVTVHLKRRTESGEDSSFDESASFGANSDFTYTFEDLDYYSVDDEIYYYYVEEDVVAGYTSTTSGEISWESGTITLTNTENNLSAGEIGVTKLWRDYEGNAKDPPDDAQISAQLWRHVTSMKTKQEGATVTFAYNGTQVDSVEVEKGTGLTYNVEVTNFGSFQRYLYLDSQYTNVSGRNSLSYSKTLENISDDITLNFTVRNSSGTSIVTTAKMTASVSDVTSPEWEDVTDTSQYPEDEVVQTESLSNSNGWSYVFTSLPLSASDNTHAYTYTYYVLEAAAFDGYVTTYSDSNDTENGISGGRTYIINTAKNPYPHYVLSDTGGVGKWIFYILSISLMVIGIFGLYRIRKKKGGGS